MRFMSNDLVCLQNPSPAILVLPAIPSWQGEVYYHYMFIIVSFVIIQKVFILEMTQWRAL